MRRGRDSGDRRAEMDAIDVVRGDGTQNEPMK